MHFNRIYNIHIERSVLKFSNTHKEIGMKTVGNKLEKFAVTGVNPGKDDFFTITEESFQVSGK